MPDDPLSSSRTAAAQSIKNVGATAANIAIRLDSPGWLEALPFLDALAREACADTLMHVLGGSADTWPEISLVFADDEFVQGLNAQYRGKDKATNVLSFPASDGLAEPGDAGELLLGDVVLAFETVRSEAADQMKALADHVAHLIVHGVLHLLGYDHDGDEDAEKMETLEINILDGLGVENPYNFAEVNHDDDPAVTDSPTDKGAVHV